MAKSEKEKLLTDYRKERRRLQSLVRSMEKRGYILPIGVVPKIPKRITEGSIRRLKALTPNVLYEKSAWKDPVTGSIFTGKQGRYYERKRSSAKGARTRKSTSVGTGDWDQGEEEVVDRRDVVLSRIEEKIRNWEPDDNWGEWFRNVKQRDMRSLKNVLDAAIAADGRDAVAKRCEENAEEVNRVADAVLYGSGGGKKGGYAAGRTEIAGDLARFAAIIQGKSLTPEDSESILDLVEENELLDENME